MSEETGSETKETAIPKKKRTRKCKNIVAVLIEGPDIGEPLRFYPLSDWPENIATMERAVKEAKKVHTAWSKEPVNNGKTFDDIMFFRRLGTLKGKSQVVMSFAVE